MEKRTASDDVVPMLNNLSVLKAENVIEGNMLAGRRTELAFADAEDLVTLGKCEVQFVIYHYHVILSHPLESGAQPVKAIGNGRIVLDVAVAIKVTSRLKYQILSCYSYI